MSSPFPQIRLHGNKTAAVQHTKRGMLELFKTQAIQERAQVPVLKRSVEVNDWTTIFVQIAEEQTFIDITCNPPVPGLEEVEKPEKKPEPGKCPAAFVVRKAAGVDKGLAGFTDNDKEQGYIIAYNHARSMWQIASYTDVTGAGNTFASCSNIGWWHASNDKPGYNQCDVLSWYGSSFYDFTIPLFNEDGDTSRQTHLAKRIMFKGRSFTTPNNVLGAAIIDIAGIDYVYIHTCSLVDYSVGYKISQEIGYRVKLSEMFNSNGDDVDWEVTGTVIGDDIEWGGASGYSASPARLLHPLSTAYVDKDGYSYMLHRANVVVPSENFEQYGGTDTAFGVTGLIKYNLRDMSHEFIYDSTLNIPTITVSGAHESAFFVTSKAVYNLDNNGFMSSNWNYSQAEPHLIWMWGGTKDMWTAAVQWNGSAHQSTVRSGVSGGTWTDNCTGAVDVSTDLIIYKNGEEHERFPFYSRSSGGVGTYGRADYTFWPPEYEEVYGELTNTTLIQYHPEIKDSWVSTRRDLLDGGATVKFSLVEGTKETLITTAARDVNLYGDEHEFWQPRMIGGANTVRILTAPLTVPSGGASSGSDSVNMYLNSLIEWGDSPLLVNYDIDERYHLGSVNTVLTQSIMQNGYGLGSEGSGGKPTRLGAQSRIEEGDLGMSTGFWIKHRPNWDSVEPFEGYAIHHNIEIDGKSVAPYIAIQRKYNRNEGLDPWLGGMREVAHGEDQLDNATPVWSEELGTWRDTTFDEPDNPGHQLNVDDWELKSNVLTEKQIRQLTKETDNMMLEIGVL